MKLLSTLKIGQRLAVSAAISLALLAAVAGLAIAKLAELNQTTEDIVKVEWVKTRHATTALDNVRGSIARVFQIVESADKDQAAQAHKRLQANTQAFDKALADLQPLIQSPEGKRLLETAVASGKAYVASYGKVIAANDAGDKAAANKIAFGDTYKALQTFASALRELTDHQQQRLEDQGEASAATYRNARNVMLGLSALAMIAAVGLSLLIARSITARSARP